jgi:hypothetical protein
MQNCEVAYFAYFAQWLWLLGNAVLLWRIPCESVLSWSHYWIYVVRTAPGFQDWRPWLFHSCQARIAEEGLICLSLHVSAVVRRLVTKSIHKMRKKLLTVGLRGACSISRQVESVKTSCCISMSEVFCLSFQQACYWFEQKQGRHDTHRTVPQLSVVPLKSGACMHYANTTKHHVPYLRCYGRTWLSTCHYAHQYKIQTLEFRNLYCGSHNEIDGQIQLRWQIPSSEPKYFDCSRITQQNKLLQFNSYNTHGNILDSITYTGA